MKASCSKKRWAVLLAMLLGSPGLMAESPIGFWQHEKEPVWIEIPVDETSGFVRRNDNNPDGVGFEMLKALTLLDEALSRWSGEVYAAKLGEFKPAVIELIDDNRLRFTVKVGFLSRTVEWRRVPSVPAN